MNSKIIFLIFIVSERLKIFFIYYIEYFIILTSNWQVASNNSVTERVHNTYTMLDLGWKAKEFTIKGTVLAVEVVWSIGVANGIVVLEDVCRIL